MGRFAAFWAIRPVRAIMIFRIKEVLSTTFKRFLNLGALWSMLLDHRMRNFQNVFLDKDLIEGYASAGYLS